jgi:hypothetical protein
MTTTLERVEMTQRMTCDILSKIAKDPMLPTPASVKIVWVERLHLGRTIICPEVEVTFHP